ncbi:MAG: beta-ketoacyl-ACP synthase II [Verrucomicrobia bacterium]|nr:beta-ketoacyl-ACP synthase II [Verrucomicrobiota bacterium]MDA1066436.1 beta-ketoacyl-ACP synthase II [Verrucomicrobiota bacterium]
MLNSRSSNRVVVTGMGLLTSLGDTPDAFHDNLLNGVSGISTVKAFDTTEYTCKIGAEIADWDPTRVMDIKEARRNDRYTQFSVFAALAAFKDSGIDMSKEDPYRVGVFVGSGIGGMNTIENQSKVLFEKGPRRVSPFMIPMLIANMGCGRVAIELGAKGPNFGIVSACTTGTNSIGEALRHIRYGDADVMIAGGSEATITQLAYAGFCQMKAMSTQNEFPEKASQPFNKGRDGFVMGEGAGVIVLESLDHALKRGANILCEISGYGATCDAYHITAPEMSGEGLEHAIRFALKDADMQPEDVDYVNAHGTSTLYNDLIETKSIKNSLGEEHARKVIISSTKSMTGHLLGAAGGIEAITCINTIRTGEVPPTINLDDQDPECDLNYTPNVKVKADIRVAISNNLGFGGHNGTLVFKRYED